MREFLSRYLLLLCVVFSMLVFFVAHLRGWELELAVLATTTLTLLGSMLLERVIPFHRQWNNNHGDLKTDITSAVVLLAVIDPVLKYAAPLLVLAAYAAFSVPGTGALLGAQPLVLQIILATLLVEFGRYWSHRMHHRVKALWRLHAMHHSSERLYAINNLRFHPLNHSLNFGFSVLPAMLLGFSPEALLGYLALSQPVLMLQHANIDLTSGWLNYLFSTNELHRWHHSNQPAEANANYGNAIVLWDHVFGTFYCRAGLDNEPGAVGLFGERSTYPVDAHYFAQLCSSIRPNCCAS